MGGGRPAICSNMGFVSIGSDMGFISTGSNMGLSFQILLCKELITKTKKQWGFTRNTHLEIPQALVGVSISIGCVSYPTFVQAPVPKRPRIGSISAPYQAHIGVIAPPYRPISVYIGSISALIDHVINNKLIILGRSIIFWLPHPPLALAPLLWRWAKAGSKIVDGEATMLWTTPCVALWRCLAWIRICVWVAPMMLQWGIFRRVSTTIRNSKNKQVLRIGSPGGQTLSATCGSMLNYLFRPYRSHDAKIHQMSKFI